MMSDHEERPSLGPPESSAEKSVALQRLLAGHEGERHVIVLQEYPDPDAISSAMAHRLISSQFNIECDILHGGRISHQENLALVKLLAIDLMRFEPGADLGGYQAAVFVDHQGSTAKEIVDELARQQVSTLVIVDHHEPQPSAEAEFTDIRRVGATASIYAQYFEKGLVALDDTIQDHVSVATAMMHGILSDTSGFIRAGAPDFEAARFLSKYRDVGLLEEIMSQARSKQTMTVIQHALELRTLTEGFSIVGVGYLREEDRDAIPQAADFLLSEENVHTSVVFGIVRKESDNEVLVGSLRTSKLTLDLDGFIKEVFGKGEDGRFFGGGKLGAGAFEIPIEFLAGEEDSEYMDLKWKVYETKIRNKIYDKIGFEPAAEEPSSAENKDS